MSEKSLKNLVMFMAGDGSQGIPTRAFITYDVVIGKAEKTNCYYELPDPDWNNGLDVIWASAIKQIRSNEGIK